VTRDAASTPDRFLRADPAVGPCHLDLLATGTLKKRATVPSSGRNGQERVTGLSQGCRMGLLKANVLSDDFRSLCRYLPLFERRTKYWWSFTNIPHLECVTANGLSVGCDLLPAYLFRGKGRSAEIILPWIFKVARGKPDQC